MGLLDNLFDKDKDHDKEKPKADGHDEKSWAENRRSDINYR